MNRKKICLLVDSDFPPDEGGPSTIHLNLSKKLVEINYEVYIVNYVKKNNIFSIIKYQIYKISSGLHILNNDYDLIITPLWYHQTISRYILRFFVKKPYIIIVHGSDFFQSGYPNLVQRGFLPKLYANYLKGCLKTVVDGSCGIISTKEIFNYMSSLLGIDEDKYRLLNFIYDKNFIKVVDASPPWEKDDAFHVLFYGRFHESKGFLYLLNAIPKIIEHSKNVKFHLVGDGPLKGEAVKFINEKRLSNHVVFHGYVPHDKIISYILVADCVVNPITWGAGLGTVTYEVISQKKPLILGNANITISNLYEQYKCYLLVKPYDADDIANKIIMMMDDPKLIAGLKQNIDRFIINEFNEEAIMSKIKNIIEESKAYYSRVHGG
jgi:glycosyltransferase involved in cell wall biosynthesis